MLSRRSLQRSILVIGLISAIRMAYADLAPVEEPMALDERVAKLERTLNSQSQQDLASRVDSLQQEVQDLRGQIEVQGHMLSQLQAAQAQQSKSASAAEAGAKAVPADATETATDQTDISNTDTDNATAATTDDSAATDPAEQKAYDTAYRLLRSKNYDHAVTALNDYIKRYPTGQNVGSAYYWLGAVYYVDSKLAEAKKAFSTVVKRFPEHPKAADALLKLGYISESQGNKAAAKQTLQRVKERYPNTSSAKAAEARLKQLGAS